MTEQVTHEEILRVISSKGGYLAATFTVNNGGSVAGGKSPWRKNRPRHCRLCGELGHDMRTCPEERTSP